MSQRGQEETLFGHPVGLFTLFFAEMWERFSYYGMRALLVFYMIKGFLGLNDGEAYAVYGAYTALVYATPFIGGIVADKLLGGRHAVILGGILMAAGHLLMGVESEMPFFIALALLIVGNGFFKPNISTMVGSLYPPGSERRDAGFTLFYMGINLGAAMSPLICGYIGETYGWHRGFNLATAGMLIGLCIFIFPPKVNIFTIGGGALGTAYALFAIAPEAGFQKYINWVIAVAIIIAAGVAVTALLKGGLPDWAGEQPEEAREKGATAVVPVYIATIISIPVIAFLLRGKGLAGIVLTGFGIVALIWLIYQIATRPRIEKERLQVVLILMFFSMLFWAFFEQAGSSVTNFTDRNIDRVTEERVLTEADVGKSVKITLNQAQLGWNIPGYDVLTIDELDKFRTDKNKALEKARESDPNAQPAEFDMELEVTQEHVGMGINGDEVPASIFQAFNPTYILIFGLVFSSLWTFMASRGIEPSIPVKFSIGLMQLGLGFGAFWVGAQQADEKGMVWVGWLLLGYLLHTTGELCISPVGLSMVTKLSPADICSTVMGSWFLALAFSNYLAALIAGLTGVEHGGGGGEGGIPAPIETLAIYTPVFKNVGIAAIVGGFVCLALSGILVKWMHMDEGGEDAE